MSALVVPHGPKAQKVLWPKSLAALQSSQMVTQIHGCAAINIGSELVSSYA